MGKFVLERFSQSERSQNPPPQLVIQIWIIRRILVTCTETYMIMLRVGNSPRCHHETEIQQQAKTYMITPLVERPPAGLSLHTIFKLEFRSMNLVTILLLTRMESIFRIIS